MGGPGPPLVPTGLQREARGPHKGDEQSRGAKAGGGAILGQAAEAPGPSWP